MDRSVMLPGHIVARVEARLPRTEFETPEEYIELVLEETLARVEATADPDGAETDLDDGAVKDRLELLGYLDR